MVVVSWSPGSSRIEAVRTLCPGLSGSPLPPNWDMRVREEAATDRSKTSTKRAVVGTTITGNFGEVMTVKLGWGEREATQIRRALSGSPWGR
jgi:hypothetical protein